jgi:hypothetical protein
MLFFILNISISCSGSLAKMSKQVSKRDRDDAKSADLISFLEEQGFYVFKEGNSFIASLDNCRVYRLDYKHIQRIWLWCDIDGHEGGDAIDLARKLVSGGNYRDAIESLKKHPNGDFNYNEPGHHLQRRGSHVFQNYEFCLPIEVPGDINISFRYLNNRGIPSDIIRKAYSERFFQPVSNGIIFIGFGNDKKPKSGTFRAAFPNIEPSKRDLAGSEKRFVPILSGSSSEVWIVEGGVDALATQAIAKLDQRETPSIIVSGGAGSSRFLKEDFAPLHVIELLKKSKTVIVAMEVEKNLEVQSKTDKNHRYQADLAGKIAKSAKVVLWKPPFGQGKDIADVLVYRLGLLRMT